MSLRYESRQYPPSITCRLVQPRQSTPDSLPSILALDLGTTTGWAVRNHRCRILQWHGRVPAAPASRAAACATSASSAGSTRRSEIAGGIDAVYFEEVRRHVGTDAAHVYGGFLATLTAWCEEHAIAYQGVPVGTIKRFATGKGNADKQAMIAAMRERGFEPADDNEADAIAILLWAIETRGGLA